MNHGSDIRIMADLPNRATHRWKGYDYANVGACYLTICTQDRLHLFGEITDNAMHLSPMGELAQRCWDAIPQHMPYVDVGKFVVMPNHVHGIVVIRERLVDVRDGVRGVGARYDAPGIGAGGVPDTNTWFAPGIGAGDADGETTDPIDASSDAPRTGMPGGDLDMPDTPAHHTRARLDAPYGIRGNRRASRTGHWARSWRRTNPRLRAWRTAMGCCHAARPCGSAIIGTV